jgi:hypothetical protein
VFALAAPSDNLAGEDMPATAGADIITTGLDLAESEVAPVLSEDIVDEINDFSVADSEMDACLTYRDFIARNAEEDAESADLNAGMLAELQSGTNGCGPDPATDHTLGGR